MPHVSYTKQRITVVKKWARYSPDATLGTPVDAFLVGGPEGVFAAWREGNQIHFATGDDGYWREVASYHRNWANDILICIGLAHEDTP